MNTVIQRFFIVLSIIFILFQDQLMYVTQVQWLSYTDEIIILVLLFMSLLIISKEKKVKKISLTIIIGIAIFSAIGMISGYLNSHIGFTNAIAANFLSIKFLILIFAFTTIRLNESTTGFLIKCIVVIADIAIIVAIINMLFPELYLSIFPWGYTESRLGIIAPSSIFEHPGTYGWFLMITASYYYVKYSTENNKQDLRKFLIYALFAIFSMKAKVMISLMVTVVMGNIISGKSKVNIKKIILSLLVVAFIAIIFHDFLIYTYVHYFTAQNGMTARGALNMNSILIALDYLPLGVGFGKFGSYYAGVNYSEYYYQFGMDNIYGLYPNNPMYATDTFWPSVIGETGMLGVIVFVICLVKIFKELTKKVKLNPNFIVPTWGLLVFLQSLVESIGAPTFNSAPFNVVIALIVSMSIQYNYSTVTDNTEEFYRNNSINNSTNYSFTR